MASHRHPDAWPESNHRRGSELLRCFALLRLFMSHHHMTAKQVAIELVVSKKTAERYLKAAQLAGFPLIAEELGYRLPVEWRKRHGFIGKAQP